MKIRPRSTPIPESRLWSQEKVARGKTRATSQEAQERIDPVSIRDRSKLAVLRDRLSGGIALVVGDVLGLRTLASYHVLWQIQT